MVLFSVVLFHGCATITEAQPHAGTIEADRYKARELQLEEDLAVLLGYRDDETRLLAHTLLSGSDMLAREYRLQPPALWHNVLVNLGLREKGLCCHWAQDLLGRVKTLHLQKYEAVWGVSHHGSWREHSSVIITAAGQAFENGLVMDPWRNAGRLYWVRVVDDSYAWQPHPGNEAAVRIRCR